MSVTYEYEKKYERDLLLGNVVFVTPLYWVDTLCYKVITRGDRMERRLVAVFKSKTSVKK